MLLETLANKQSTKGNNKLSFKMAHFQSVFVLQKDFSLALNYDPTGFVNISIAR